jgi:pyruvate dehydrogenase E2 component (dihydrolipoamide acetyltransferase)
MTKTQEVLVPDIGDFEAVDIVEILVNPGDQVDTEDPLITLESDKATMEVPSPFAGKVVEVKVKMGDKVGEGAVILVLEVDEAVAVASQAPETEAAGSREMETAAETDGAVRASGEPAPASHRPAEKSPAPRRETPMTPSPPVPAARDESLSPAPVDEFPFSKTYASPAIRRYARELGVDLGRVSGTGRKGRVLKEDVQGFVKKSLSQPEGSQSAGLPEMPKIDFSRFGEVELQPLTRIQKISKVNVHRSWLHVPHVTQHDEADITDLDSFRRAHAEEAEAQGFKLTPVAFLMKAAVGALQRFPRLNSSLDPDGGQVVLKKYYHLGIAVDTEQGLMVPVVRDVDQKGIFELAKELAEVSEQARAGKLRPDQIYGASFTITSLGGIGGTDFTPIVNAPEVAILGVSRAVMRPIWDGRDFVPRLMLPLSLSYDHRVVDGALGVRFTTYLCNLLGDLRRLLL